MTQVREWASRSEAEVALLARLDIADKIRLLTGRTSWATHPVPHLGLRSMILSDGPVGVRGTTAVPSDWSLLLPAPSALAATWDPDAARALGRLFAAEARRKGVDVVLAPVVNLQRTPVAGRHFEYLSEDPVLTGHLAVALVRAVQEYGIGMCLKHFVANDSETERTSYLAAVDETTLREVYLAPFEQVVREASPWMVMAAYNRVAAGGLEASATEHRYLLTDLLKTEWGYDGVVVSDWLAASSTEESALAGLDLVMPGPGGPWEDRLLAAVEAGVVPVEVIDDKAARLLRLAGRIGALDADALLTEDPAPAPDPDLDLDGAHALLTRLAAQATVVLRNDAPDGVPTLPLEPTRLQSIALIGAAATAPFVQGGGSGLVFPERVVTPVEGLRAALPAGVVLTVHDGVPVNHLAPALDLTARATDPRTGLPGLRAEVLDAVGTVLADEHLPVDWAGRYEISPAVPDAAAVRLTARVRLTEPGVHQLAVGTVGEYQVLVDGAMVDAGHGRVGSEVILDSSVNEPPGVPVPIEVTAARSVTLTAVVQVIDGDGYGRFARAALRHLPPGPSVDQRIEQAVRAAAQADVAVVIVGTSVEIESEGRDRTGLALPGRQDELVTRVVAANPRTVVVVNAGAPVLLPWLDGSPGPAAVLWWWLPGQEAGHALAAVLLGDLEPAGRLPWTLPASADDVPVPHARPVDGVLTYHEGADVGYRAWQRLGRRPARPFGFGLGWGDWRYDAVAVTGSLGSDDLAVTVTVTNLGRRAASEVVQVYATCPADDELPEVRRLVGSARVDVAPAASSCATVRLPRRVLQSWDPTHGWRLATREIHLQIGRDSADLRSATTVAAASPESKK